MAIGGGALEVDLDLTCDFENCGCSRKCPMWWR